MPDMISPSPGIPLSTPTGQGPLRRLIGSRVNPLTGLRLRRRISRPQLAKLISWDVLRQIEGNERPRRSEFSPSGWPSTGVARWTDRTTPSQWSWRTPVDGQFNTNWSGGSQAAGSRPGPSSPPPGKDHQRLRDRIALRPLNDDAIRSRGNRSSPSSPQLEAIVSRVGGNPVSVEILSVVRASRRIPGSWAQSSPSRSTLSTRPTGSASGRARRSFRTDIMTPISGRRPRPRPPRSGTRQLPQPTAGKVLRRRYDGLWGLPIAVAVSSTPWRAR